MGRGGGVRWDVSEASTEEAADRGSLGLERTGVAAARWSVCLLTGSDRGRDGHSAGSRWRHKGGVSA